MATTSEYLEQLKTDKQNLGTKMSTRGVTVSDDDTFTTLVAKFDEIQSGGGKYAPRAISFYDFSGDSLEEELKNLDVSNLISMASMFKGCTKLTSLDLSNFDTSNIRNMHHMFYMHQDNSSTYGGQLQELNLSGFNTSQVRNMNSMFYYCSSLKTLDLSNFDTHNVTDMSSIFYSCKELVKLKLPNFNGTQYANRSNMFKNCTKLEMLILTGEEIFNLQNATFLNDTKIASGTGYVYVPDNMVETYKNATNWTTYASQIKGMSELPKEEI